MKGISRLACAIVVASSAMAINANAQSSTDNGSKGPNVDNTNINKRDDASSTIKPTDQPNDASNIKLAAAVRKAIVSDKSLSTSAHNVKLVAANGDVTLRGPVTSASEKTKVAQIVAGVSGVSNVNNELDIKTN